MTSPSRVANCITPRYSYGMATDWRDERDDEGFPVANEDRDGDLFRDDEYGVLYVCKFIDGLGWCWVSFERLDGGE